MGFSGKTLRLTAVLALICIAATLSAGCIGVANPTPNQARGCKLYLESAP